VAGKGDAKDHGGKPVDGKPAGGKPGDGKANAGKTPTGKDNDKDKHKPGKAGVNHPKRVGITPKTTQLDWDWPSIAFDNGVPVGGRAHLTLRQDGSYTFQGHYHDSGVIGYQVYLVYVVKDSQNRAYTFVHRGGVAGLFGNRDDDWNDSGKNAEIAKNWASISGGSAVGRAGADLDFGALIDEIKKAVGVIEQAIEIVGDVILAVS
jgi:hypothetical protein